MDLLSSNLPVGKSGTVGPETKRRDIEKGVLGGSKMSGGALKLGRKLGMKFQGEKKGSSKGAIPWGGKSTA